MSAGSSKGDSGAPNRGSRPGFPGSNAFSIVVICVLMVVGAVIAPLIALELPWWRAALGGALLGAFGGFATA